MDILKTHPLEMKSSHHDTSKWYSRWAKSLDQADLSLHETYCRWHASLMFSLMSLWGGCCSPWPEWCCVMIRILETSLDSSMRWEKQKSDCNFKHENISLETMFCTFFFFNETVIFILSWFFSLVWTGQGSVGKRWWRIFQCPESGFLQYTAQMAVVGFFA